ncbi:hypothetical protein ABZS66_25880 [Dactylosporangium sp. NPDC005572]|uniref:hypothetical protein n=1 Tax=Dactylosporangium sp. NPDC005572 TaxID=3156889 RepID=UPI0033AB8526
MSAEAARILGSRRLPAVTASDLVWPDVIDDGWVVVDGAVLLAAWFRSYHGDRSRFRTTTDYELAVNGRGIHDLDLTGTGEARVRALLRRGVAFAQAALDKQRHQLPGVIVTARVSAASVLLDPSQFTGYVTFCSRPIDVQDEIAVSL